ncbi:hypothetical protein GOD78_31370 [Sinorhizobium medicae]|nr:hypothetical protein [Sinorhizobium medicae]MDX0821844.1 hypothetical protein [Sinorhizobium medicae]MDX0864890.1 hypothetical protein [Sinorhizobium medicae]
MKYERPSFVVNSNVASPVLTVIITIRTAPHYDMVERLKLRRLDTSIPQNVSFLVVDEGSSQADSQRLRAVCRELSFDYLRVTTEKRSFCAATARNLGAAHARSTFIMHEDVDLFGYPGYYQALVREIKLQGLVGCSKRFITVPALYLTTEATEEATSGALSKDEIIHDFLLGGPMVRTSLPASSVIIINRMYYLSIGGYNDQFSGWGLEDLEFAYRLVRASNSFMSPLNHTWLVEAGYATASAYRGWRAQFRLHGEILARKGLFVFHAAHPKDPSWRNKDSHGSNKRLFAASIERFEAEGHYLPPIPAAEKGKSLIFGRGTFAYNPALLPLWGELEVKSYSEFEDVDVVEYLRSNNISRVIFTNPYANDTRLRVYTLVRAAGIPYYVVERGALTDSMFIDDTGFCCESTRYRREHWPDRIDRDRLRRVMDYIASETESDAALEKQGRRLGARAALQKLGLPSDKKVLFVPFQSRSDTTVRFFAGDIGTFDNFVELVREVTQKLPSDWAVIFKKHPLSSVPETVPGAIDAGDMHIKDLLAISDCVLLMNSGVGVLSILFDRPVIHTAQAFYSDEKLNRKATTADQVLEILKNGFEVEQESRLRFLSYLIEDFYSFGKFTVSERQHTGNAKLTITERIDYYRVNLVGQRILDTADDRRFVDVNAPVYDQYREWIRSQKYSEACHIKSSKPGNSREAAVSARKAYHRGQHKEAARLFDLAAKLNPNKATHYREAAEAFFALGRKLIKSLVV